MSQHAALQAHFTPLDGTAPQPAPGRHVLGTVAFGERTALSLTGQGYPELAIPMASPGFDSFREVWTTGAEPVTGTRGGLAFAHDGEYLFISGAIEPLPVYGPTVREVYEEAFALVGELGYPHIFRMWNFVGGIISPNAEGMEIYQDFVAGRAEAFASYGDGTGHMPAATGIGTRGEGISFTLLACREGSPRHVENQRQTPAYHYPEQYGPKPPSFARATRLHPAGGEQGDGALFVSGTASILGHETVHRGDIAAQTDVVLENIAELISGPNLAAAGLDGGHELKDLRLVKVYVRHEADLPVVRERCQAAFGPDTEVMYMNVAVCRDDLLVEIEGLVPGREWTR
ncbi:FkbO/Hyg5 family chorismatase [Streptomyces hiroshimensis]|uniref:Pteridine-dependent deoxygenase like protein n=1 Tax=Streptomyces hiroshimensis TaxID=66424 RepID=A0ABQ2YNX1_9ACTN|nr:FkbO/Hyg5 family chorismatase [Streptomyces hiroshimensis]GGX90023.1 pteridine-dependent deoxygenase like protein [Streptomyces hiroshimensis]